MFQVFGKLLSCFFFIIQTRLQPKRAADFQANGLKQHDLRQGMYLLDLISSNRKTYYQRLFA